MLFCVRKRDKGSISESDQVGSKQTEDLQKTSAVEEKDEKFNQEQSNQENHLNTKVIYVEQTRFAMEITVNNKKRFVHQHESFSYL